VSSAHQGLILTLQLLLVLPLLWQLGRFLIDSRELFSPNTVVAGGFVGLYVASYYFADDHARSAFLTVDGYLDLLLLAVLACYAFAAGFVLGRGCAGFHERAFDEPTVRCYAIALIGIGLASQVAFVAKSGGFLTFYGAPRGAGGAWADTSAYLYSTSNLTFPAMCLLCGLLARQGLTGLFAQSVFLAALAYSAFHAFVSGGRGDTILLFLLLVLPPLFLARRVRVGRPTVLLVTALVLAAVLLLPHVRKAVYLGAEKSLLEAVGEAFADEAISLDPSKGTGYELFYAAAVVEAAAAENTYHYGFGWIYPFVNLVPRAWWPDKPYRRDWSMSEFRLVQQHAGWSVSYGAAATGVADAFLGFSWFSIAVWLALGWWSGVIWVRATGTGNVIDVARLWAFLVIAVYFVTQDYIAAWHAWLFFMVPISFVGLLMPATASRPDLGRRTLGSLPGRSARQLRAPAP